MNPRQLSQVLIQILNASDEDISKIIQAVIKRYEMFYPDDEVVFLSLPTDDLEERRAILAAALETLEKTEPSVDSENGAYGP